MIVPSGLMPSHGLNGGLFIHWLCLTFKYKKYIAIASCRGVPIIGSATISATDMAFFTNIRIGTEQQEDRYHYRYLYSSNGLYINGLCIGFLRYSCGSLVPVAYCSLCNKRYATRSHINARDS